jgi:hypothetical protein
VNVPGESVLDVCCYDNHIFVLLTNKRIVKLTDSCNEVNTISNNVCLSWIDAFAGYLYGATSKTIYKLDTNTYSSDEWKWVATSLTYKDITYFQATLDSENLYVEADGTGYIYSVNNDYTKPSVVEKFAVNKCHTRVYGIDTKHYLVIDKYHHTAVKYPSQDKISCILTGALNYNNDVIKVLPDQKCKIEKVKIVNWNPFYIIFP